MPQASDAVWLPVLPSMRDFGPALIKGAGDEAEKAGGPVGKKFGAAIAVGVTAVVGGIAAAGGALYKVGAVFDDVADTIRVGTGASGKALDGLVASAKNVGSRVPADFAKIGPTVADLNTRLGLSGETLETVASQYLEAGRILGQDVDINATSAAFSAFGIAGADVEGAMDSLFRVSQATGVGMNELAGIVQKSAPAMQTLGFSFEETAALAGTLDKAGLNTQQVMASMSKGLVTLAKDGEKPQDAFKRTVGEIKGFIAAGDEAGALNLASKVFGTRGATQFIGALQEGKVNLDDLVASAGMTDDTILGLGKETADFAEQWQLFKNRVLVWLEPLGSKVFGALGTAMGEVNGAVMAFGAAWKANDGDITSSGLPGFFERLAFLARKVWDSLGPAFSNVVAAFSTLGPTFAALLPQVIQLVSSFSPLGLLFKVLTPVLPLIVNLFSQLASTAASVLAAVLPLATSLVSALVPVIVNLVSAILPPVIDLFMQIVSAIAPLVEMILAILVPAIQFLMPIVQFAFEVIANVAKIAIGIVVAILSGLVGFVKDTLAPAVTWLWQNVVQPAFEAIGKIVTWVWENVISPAFSAIKWYIDNILAPVINWLWQNIVQPAFDGIGKAVSWAWERVILPAVSALKWYFDNVLGPVFTWLYETIIKPAWDGISTAITNVWNWLRDNVFAPIQNAIEKTIPDAFNAGKDAIGKAWTAIANFAKAPINFVVDTILNNGILKAINDVRKFFGIGGDDLKIPWPPAGWNDYYEGGYTGDGGKYEPKGIVHGGEFVFTKEQTARIGKNRLASWAAGSPQPGSEGWIWGGFQNQVLGARALNIAGVGGFPASAIGSAITAWNGRAGVNVNAGGAGPTVYASMGSLPGYAIGYYYGGNSIVMDPAKAGGLFTPAFIHEVGHALGLGHAPGQNSIMEPMLRGPLWPTAYDTANLQALYGAGTGDIAEGGGGGGFFNPLAGMLDGLLAKIKEMFSSGGVLVDIVVGAVKKAFDDGMAWIASGFKPVAASTDQSSPVLLRDQGGVLPEGLSSVLNMTGAPEWVLNRGQLETLDNYVLGAQQQGPIRGELILKDPHGSIANGIAGDLLIEIERA